MMEREFCSTQGYLISISVALELSQTTVLAERSYNTLTEFGLWLATPTPSPTIGLWRIGEGEIERGRQRASMFLIGSKHLKLQLGYLRK